jgi:spermidine/putrescine transport system ATP-binding protein/putrescine transport system ATP-binding protein
MRSDPPSDAPVDARRDTGTERPGGTPLLGIRDVHRHFGTVRALDGVSLDIRRNEFFALLGPSGCGKTTLLRIIAGFEEPDSGSILLDGVDLTWAPPHRRPVNLMFQSYALFPHMTVWQNIAFGLQRERLPRPEIRDRVAEVLATVGLEETASRRPAQLSGGQRQRVALARAMVKRPRLLLLDEPLSALDKQVRADMQLELKRLQHEVGITFVVVTHDQTEAMALADRIAVLDAGRVEQVDDPITLYERPATVFVASFIGQTNLFRGEVVDGRFGAAGVDSLPAPLGPDGAAVLSVRPERIALAGPGAGVRDGTVLEVQFLGGVSTVAVDLPGHDRPLLVTSTGAARLRRGDRVSVHWSPDDGVMLPG